MARPALHVAVALALVLAGCSVLAPDHTREERAVSALADARDTVNATETYRYETDVQVVATADGRTERVDITLNGSVDAANRRMHSHVRYRGDRLESYLVNRTAYQECGGMMDLWRVEEQSADDWTTLTPAARQLSLLETGSLSWNGTETVDGRETVLLVGEPTERGLRQYQEDRSRSLLGGPSIENARVEVWLDAETHHPVRSAFSFEVRQRGNTASASMTTRFDDYGESVSVGRPVIDEDQQWDAPCP